MNTQVCPWGTNSLKGLEFQKEPADLSDAKKEMFLFPELSQLQHCELMYFLIVFNTLTMYWQSQETHYIISEWK